jgi:hypothetical protein
VCCGKSTLQAWLGVFAGYNGLAEKRLRLTLIIMNTGVDLAHHCSLLGKCVFPAAFTQAFFLLT